MKTLLRNSARRRGIFLLAQCFFICLSMTARAGDNPSAPNCTGHVKPGLAVGMLCSGNGHGAYYNVMGSLRIHRSTFMAGPCLQKVSGRLNGAKAWYSYSLTGVAPSCRKNAAFDETEDMNTELSFFASIQAFSGARFCESALLMENGRDDEKVFEHYRSIKVNTIEMTLGMGFNFRLFERMHVRTFVGVAYYQHLNFHENMVHDARAVVLNTGFGIGLFN